MVVKLKVVMRDDSWLVRMTLVLFSFSFKNFNSKFHD